MESDTEVVRLYFQYRNGVDDSIILEADSVEEMNCLIDQELEERDAVFTGVEYLESD